MIELLNLYKRFDTRQIYRDLSLAIPENEITVILGKSGVGKSVLLKHILGLISPDSGKVIIEGTDIVPLSNDQQREFRLKFGMVFQSSALLDSLTVEENVGLGLRKLTNQSEGEIREKVRTCLEQVGLGESAHLLPEKLSGGMKKRAAFARAITRQPKYLLYDEPTTGLDPVTGDLIVNLILKFNRTLETTSLVVTHDMAATMKVADRIALLEDGQIQAVLTPAEFESGTHPLAREFIAGASYDLNGNSD